MFSFYWSLVCDATRLLLVSRQAFVLLLYKSDTPRMDWVQLLYSVTHCTQRDLTRELTHKR